MPMIVRIEWMAAHEAGHATVFLGCGIPVLWVEATPSQPAAGVYRYGWTEAREYDWVASAPLNVASLR
jgi:hypothetical protein